MRTRALIAVAVVGVVSVAVIAAGLRYVGSQEDSYALRVNGAEISREEIEDTVRANTLAISLGATLGTDYEASVPGAATDRNAIVDTMIDSELLDAEARRREIACSNPEVLQTQRANFVASGELGLIGPVAAGFAPADYFQTPVAARTPDAEALYEAFMADEKVLQTLHRLCRRTKLFEQISAAAGDGQARTAAIIALTRELRTGATIDRAPGY